MRQFPTITIRRFMAFFALSAGFTGATLGPGARSVNRQNAGGSGKICEHNVALGAIGERSFQLARQKSNFCNLIHASGAPHRSFTLCVRAVAGHNGRA